MSRLLAFLRRHPEVLHVETDSAGAVPEALSDLSRQEVDLLVVNGGDGTLQYALTEILGNREFGDRVPMIAALRGGRTNMTAMDIGGQRDPVKAMAQLIEAARTGTMEERVVPRPVLRVEYGHYHDVHYGMFFGAGMIHRAIELTHRVMPQGRARGVWGGTLITALLLGRSSLLGDTKGVLTPDKVEMLADGEPVLNGALTMVISSSLQRLFAGMRPFWGTGPGGVRVTTIASGAPSILKAAPGILRDSKKSPVVTEENGYTSRNAKRVELRMDCGFTVDGELVPAEAGRIVSITADDTVRFVRS